MVHFGEFVKRTSSRGLVSSMAVMCSQKKAVEKIST